MSHDAQRYRWEHYGKNKKHPDKEESKSELKHRHEKDTVMEFTITPLGTDELSTAGYVALASRICRNHELKHEVHPMGTVVEGSVDECLDLLKDCIEKSVQRGPRIILSARIDVRPGEYQRMDKKHKKILEINHQTGEST